jgi:hypothetical protein
MNCVDKINMDYTEIKNSGTWRNRGYSCYTIGTAQTNHLFGPEEISKHIYIRSNILLVNPNQESIESRNYQKYTVSGRDFITLTKLKNTLIYAHTLIFNPSWAFMTKTQSWN